MPKAKASVSSTIRRVRDQSNPPATKAETAARIVHPTASSIAAAEIVIVPTRVRVRFSSIIMRPKMGNAVIDIAVPMNRARCENSGTRWLTGCGSRAGYRIAATPAPSANGSTIPAEEIAKAALPLVRRWRKSNSRPTRNNSRIRPIWLRAVKIQFSVASNSSWGTAAECQCGWNTAAHTSGKK